MDAVDNFLIHYGVKGMKWGTRKGLQVANENFNRVSLEVQQRQEAARYNSTLSEAAYRHLSDKDIVIAKSSVVQRTSKGPWADTNYRDLFVSTNEADAKMYRGILPTGDTGGVPAKNHVGYYETAFAATKDLTSPSEKKRVDAYIRLMDVPEIKLSTGESVNGREYMRRQGLGDTVNALSSKELALTYYGQLAVTQGIHNDPINTAYFNSFRDQGYTALVDDNDRGVFASQPLLVFDAQKHLRTVAVKQLTTEEIQEAQATLTIPDALVRHSLGSTSASADIFLAHYGVKGMKWGKRQSGTGEPKPKMSREKKIAIAVGVGTTAAVGAAIALSILSGKKVEIPPVQSLSTNKTMLAGKSNLVFNAAAMSAKVDRLSPTNIPGQTLTTNKTMLAGKSNLIFNAASMAANAPKPRGDLADIPVQKLTTNKTMLAGKANLIFNAAAMSAQVPSAPKQGLVDKAKEKAFDTAKTVAVNKLEKTTYSDFKALRNPPPRTGVKAKATGAVKDKAKKIVIKKAIGGLTEMQKTL